MFSFFKKHDYAATIEPGNTCVVVRHGGKLLDAALAAGLDWPHDCRVGSCGTCRCVLKSGRIKPLTDFAYTLAPEELRAGVILACQTQLRSDVTIEITLAASTSATDTVRGTIESLHKLTHDILEVRIKLAEPAFASAQAGQYADLQIAGLDAPRSYSFLRAPRIEADGQVTFCIRRVPGGAFTEWLFGADRQAALLTLSGPYGGFRYHAATGRMICVAGGSGIAPVYAILLDVAAANIVRDCVVLFGARTTADLYYLDELATLRARWRGNFELIPVLSMEPSDSAWRGARGLVADALAGCVPQGSFTADDQGYLCGPPAMVDAGIAAMHRLGMAREAIYCDRFLDASTQPGGRDALAGQPPS